MIKAMSADQEKIRVWVTRPFPQAVATALLFEKMGTLPWVYPLLERVALPCPEADQALSSQSAPDYLIFTSSQGVHEFAARCQKLQIQIPQHFQKTRIASVGNKTSASLKALGLQVQLQPQAFNGIALAQALLQETAQTAWIFRARQGDPALSKALRQQDWQVQDFHVYDTLSLSEAQASKVIDELNAHNIQAITLLSPSAVKALDKLCGETIRQHPEICLASLGPATSKALKQAFGRVDIEAPEATVPALAREILKHFQQVAA